ncbi:MAG TPA: ABC transporter permease [Candidatus Sulfotelmatobacter sp.]|nr:ABC transporter permease [Candidatus Sulfotelmatobacter sp.]
MNARPGIVRRNPAFSFRRVGAMVLRHWFVLRGSWPRLVELAYWPTVQMVLWGFMTKFLVGQTSYFAQAFGVLLSGVLLWDVLFRGQLGVAISFFEEIWARNLGHLFVSPLRPYEMILSLGAMSLIRTVIGVVPAAAMAVIFFGFNLASLGLSLAGFFFLLLVMGWALGLLICGIVMRYGQGAETLAWAAIFAVAPVSGVYYPIAVLPAWLQAVAHCLPSAYVFEGMRGILVHHEIRVDLMLVAAALDLFYLLVGSAAFLAYFRMARRRGLLLQQGE